MNCCDKSLTKPLLGEKTEKLNSNKRRKRRSSINNNSVGENGYYCDEYDLDQDPDILADIQFNTMTNTGCSMTLRRILLLLWKNFLFRRRHYIISALEIILPTLLAMLLAYMRTQSPSEEIKIANNNVTIFPRVSELIMRSHVGTVFHKNDIVAYAPKNDLTTRIMDQLKNSLPDATFGLRGFENDGEIELLISEIALNESTQASVLKAAIVFEKGLDIDNNFPTGHKISYKIRMVDELKNTGELFPWFQLPGPSSSNVVNYVNAGFSGLQIALDKILMKLLTNIEPLQTIDVQAFPYPPFVQTFSFTQIYFFLLPQFLVLGFIFMVPSIIRNVVSEKETGIKELMKMMGLPNWMHWLGWMLNSMVILMLSITIVIFLFFVAFNSDAGPFLVFSDPTLWWFILCLYAMSATAFCFFISTFFQRPTLAMTFGIVLWLVSYYGISIPLDSKYRNLTILEKMAAALVPNIGLHLVIKAMCGLEGKSVGAHWHNIGEPINSLDELSVGHMCVMFIVDTFLYMALTIYFENIIPSQFGLRKSWYYIFKPSSWLPRRKINISRESSRANSAGDGQPGFESEPPSLTPGIVVQNLSKRFGRNKVAVDQVSMKMFDGQITALLGHNGAGKTTTMSMLTGMFAPSGGTALVNGYDINTQMNLVRSSLGLCPQHNLLFDKLTVEEHLVFFGRLKGLTSGQAKAEMKTLLEKLQLREKRNALSMSLSGGQKRKLSLGMALIGGTKVVILDEPTSGMDPEARRAIWDILLEMRGQRTIVLTTHFMEEADVLGDRIAIMADGKIKCCGTPMYLKRFYGAGYTLKMSTEPHSIADLILYTVQKHVPSASLKFQKFMSATEVAITLPSEGHSTSLFPPMFADLAENKVNLGIKTMGLSLTTMDEVFVKVGELTHDEDEDKSGKTIDTNDSSRNRNTGIRTSLHLESIRGVPLILGQIWALLLKRFIYTMRKRRLFVSQFVMPLLLLIVAITLSNRHFSPTPTPPPLKMSLADYRNAKTLYTFDDKVLADNYASIVGSSATLTKDNLMGTLVEIGEHDAGLYRSLYIVGADLNSTVINAMFSSIPDHANPLAINLVSNTILRTLAPDKKYLIEVTNHPLQNGIYSIIEAAQPNPTFSTVIPILFGIFIPIGLALFAATYVVFPVEEKLCKAKQLQLMTGVSPLIFWGSSFIWDFFVMAILITLMVMCFPIFQNFGAFTSHGGGGVIFLILLVYGFSAISFSYLCSTFVSTVHGGFALVTIIHILTGMIMSLVVFILENAELGDKTTTLRHIGRLFPTFGVSLCMMRYTSVSTKNSRCNILPEKVKNLICNSEFTVGPELRQCCTNCGVIPGTTCFQPEPYLEWSYKSHERDIPGVGQDLLYLFLVGILYKCLVLMVEYGVIQRIVSFIFKSKNSTFTSPCEDPDVQTETQRVQTLVHTGRIGDDALVVDGLCKSYGMFSAVSNLSFGVHHGECFGLLGVNGAGKTTTFRMLTGDEIRSCGNAFSFSCNLDTNRTKFLGSIGYCPQFDGIVGVLSGREMLELFCRLRGVPKSLVTAEADKWLLKMGLYESATVQCQKYSGGMKRRLSAAMALIGDPPIILLDEPTTGVDPVARRQFWNVISEVRDSGQAVILTSHSMEECEALCSRLGIMVNGQFQCLGGVQHLKNKFAQGFSLVLKLKPMISTESPELKSLNVDISTKFHPCTLKDQHQNILNYQVFNTAIPWDVLFQTMEDLKAKYQEIIEDYAVNETTLEEVFLSFARKQYSNRQADVSFIKKLITCQCCQ